MTGPGAGPADGSVVLVLVDPATPGWEPARSRLEDAGYRVVDEVPDAGADVLSLVEHHAPALLLAGGGVDLGSLPSGLPVIVALADPTAGDLASDRLATVHDIVRIPLDPVDVLARVRAAARVRTLQDELAFRIRELDALGRTDVLTGLVNRRQIEEHLQMVSSSARRLRKPYSLLMVDVDHFRRLNESEGRPAGDSVLREVAVRIARGLRGEDVAGRWGGEEFLVILPHTPLDGAWKLAERIRQIVSETPVELAGERDVVVTISAGCSEGCGDDVEDHIRRAEAALEEAKATGRNRVVADTTPVAP